MTATDYTAENWPIACRHAAVRERRLPRRAHPGRRPEEWAKHLNLVPELGFTEVDPTDTWVRVADLSPDGRLDFQSVLEDAGLTIPGDLHLAPQRHGPRARQGIPRVQPPPARQAAAIGVPMVSFGFFQAFTPAQEKVLWFWLADGCTTTTPGLAVARPR